MRSTMFDPMPTMPLPRLKAANRTMAFSVRYEDHDAAYHPGRVPGLRRARLRYAIILGMLLPIAGADAQPPTPTSAGLAASATQRFPQPVRVGDLLRRKVLEPVESMPTIGRVRDVTQQTDGALYIVVDYGGLFGFFTRRIAIPVDAMALAGQYMEILDFTPKQLDDLKTFDTTGTTPLPPDSVIRVGLVGPSH